MSEPKRYIISGLHPHIIEDKNGFMIYYEDYARLRALSFVTAVPVEQYERLLKAGDAMADEIIGCYNAEGYDPADSQTLREWNAAKEGKQS